MTTNFYPSNLQWVGIAQEDTYGVAKAAPTVWVPVDAPKYKSTITPLKDQALRGAMATTYQQQQGLRHDELTYKTYFYADSVFQHFFALLGNFSTSGEYSYATSLYNGPTVGYTGRTGAQPASFTLFWADATGKVQQIPGAVAADVKVGLNADALATLDITWMGLPAVTIDAPANTPTSIKPMPSWNTAITVGSVALTSYSSIELDFKRATEMIPTITGSQTPFAIFGGPVSVTGSLTGVFQNDSADVNWTNYLAGTHPALTVTIAPPASVDTNLEIYLGVVAYDLSEVSGTNKWQEIKATVEALATTDSSIDTSLSPAVVVLTTPTEIAF